MFNFITISLFIAVLATSFNPQIFQQTLLKQQIQSSTSPTVIKGRTASTNTEDGNDQKQFAMQALNLASNQDMMKIMLQSSAKELRARYTKDEEHP